jgi:nitroreductase
MGLDIIFARRSIRTFTSEPVADSELKTLLEAAMAAPSANNFQPWHFVAVRDREVLNRLADAHPYGKMLYEATCAIAVCGDPGISDAYWIQDCSAATQNILLAATALGLGSVWLGCTPREARVKAIQDVLGIPENIPVLSLVAIGRPAEKKPPRTRFDPDKVHYDRW